MKNFFFAIILSGIIFTINICAAAQDVRLTDYKIGEIAAVYNKFAEVDSVINNQPKFAEKVNIGDQDYENYSVEVGNGENYVSMVFMTTADGYVSKIMLFGKSFDNLAKVTASMWKVCGLNQSEGDKLIELMSANHLKAHVRCSAKQRNIKTEFYPTERGVSVVILSAFKD